MPILYFAAKVTDKEISITEEDAFHLTAYDGMVPLKIAVAENGQMVPGVFSDRSLKPLRHPQCYWMNETTAVYGVLIDESKKNTKPSDPKKWSSFVYSEDEINRLKKEQQEHMEIHEYDAFNHGMDESKKIKIFEFPVSSIQVVGLYFKDNATENAIIFTNPLIDCEDFLKYIRKASLRENKDSINAVPHEFKIMNLPNKMKNNLSMFYKNKKGVDTEFTFEASRESTKPSKKK